MGSKNLLIWVGINLGQEEGGCNWIVTVFMLFFLDMTTLCFNDNELREIKK